LCSIDDEYVEDVRRFLTVLCFSIRPLTVDELIDAHAVDLGETPYLDRDGRSYKQDDLVDICLGLIEIVATEDANGQNTLTAHIAHFSVQEYLQSNRILQQNSRGFAMPGDFGNAELARICLVYLLEPVLSSGILNEAKLRDFPLAHFAALNWFHHYTKSGEEKPEIEQLVLKLFNGNAKSFVTWIRLHDMDRPGKIDVHYDRRVASMASPLYYAALLGLEDVLNGILATNTGDASIMEALNDQAGQYGNAFQVISFGCHEKVVQMLLDQGSGVNAQGGYHGNALQAASYRGHEKVVQMLLNQGANVNAQGGDHGNALQAASYRGHEKVVQMLLDRGADVNARGGDYGNALQAASFGGHAKVVQMLLDRGADVDAQGGLYGNALCAASYGGHAKAVQIMLDRDADVNAQGGYFGNALQVASSEGHAKVVQILLDRDADVDAQGGLYGNALCAASFGGHAKVVQMLLDRGADVNAQGGDYGNALQAASYRGYEKVFLQMLLDRDADVNAQSGHFGNALQAGSFRGHEEVVQMLLDRGATVNSSDKESRPPRLVSNMS
jgi:ankyrin repeat protein